MCQAVGWLSAGATVVTDVRQSTWQKKGLQRQQKKADRLASDFQASDWLRLRKNSQRAPNSGTDWCSVRSHCPPVLSLMALAPPVWVFVYASGGGAVFLINEGRESCCC